jgi:predicted enzyme related to lactoylglutathione lyase
MSMTKTVTIAPVNKVITVSAPQQRAFDVFTSQMDKWWPRSHHIGGAPMTHSTIEPRVGGRWFVQHEDGSTTVPGIVKVWDPPHRLVHSWDISAAWKPDATVGSEVEVRFIAEGPNRTRVELEHRNFERLGEEGGRSMREAVNSDGGWNGILDSFRKIAETTLNRIVHFEIHATDPATLSQFYAKAFGWNFRHLPEMDYYLFDNGGQGIGGGMPKRMGPKPSGDGPVNGFVSSIGVESLDDTLKRALEAGATLALPKMAIPGVGWQAYVKDPDNNILGIHQADLFAK